MKHVKELEGKIEETGIYRIGYIVQSINEESFRHFIGRKQHLAMRLQPQVLDSLFPNRFDDLEQYSISFQNNKMTFNNKILSENELSKTIEETLEANPNYLFTLDYGEDLHFGNYIKMYSILKKSFSDKRNELSLTKYNQKFDWISREERKEILKKYPFLVKDNYKR